jgi:hypothetical protein
MKNKFLIVSSVLVFSILGSRCGGADCARTDCGNPILPVFSFRLVGSTGNDLIGGVKKQYDSANVKILAKRTSSGAVENIKRHFQVIADTNYITGFSVNKDFSIYYLSLNNTVTDSLLFGYNTRQTECCDKSFFSLNKFNTSDLTPPLALPQNSYPIVK